jgi:hypothetical protein
VWAPCATTGVPRGRDAPAHINYEASGIDKQPTIQFSGVNLQVIDGSGSESTINGTGNLILGYGGMGNQASAENSSVSGGALNLAGNLYASVSAGKENKATGEGSSVSGGGRGEASGAVSSVTGGRLGKAPYFASTVLGGLEEVTEAEFGVTP